jgi:hypothetical protein
MAAKAAPTSLDRYLEYLKRVHRPTDEAHEREDLRMGAWRFYDRGPFRGGDTQDGPGTTDRVALDDGGRVVAAGSPSDWFELLATPGLTAAQAHQRICWLLGRPAPVGRHYHFKDPDLARRVGDPTLKKDDRTVTFVGWVVYPPEMNFPYRVRIVATRGASASVETQPWNGSTPQQTLRP